MALPLHLSELEQIPKDVLPRHRSQLHRFETMVYGSFPGSLLPAGKGRPQTQTFRRVRTARESIDVPIETNGVGRLALEIEISGCREGG